MEAIKIHRIIEAKPLSGYNLWIRYEDGVSGRSDLSYLVGRGVFSFVE
ncbi:MAG: hypothetical protein ACE5GG_04925 [Candidatus Omnitrophota bacterium]